MEEPNPSFDFKDDEILVYGHTHIPGRRDWLTHTYITIKNEIVTGSVEYH
jgi:hypothetical protein